MGNVLDRICRGNENTHFIFYNFFSPENRIVYEIISKNVLETEGPQMTSQYGAYAFRAGLARLCARMRMHTPTSPGTHMHARTHTPINNTYCFSTATIIRESTSLLRYTYIVFLVIF